jgi:hypothetical protein
MNEPIFYKGKKIGEVNLEKSYYISYRTDEHIFRIFEDGFGISEKIIDKLDALGIKQILINFKDQELFITSLDRFIIFSKPYSDGEDKQLILPRSHFFKQKPNYTQERLEL